jgi:hypothetical protein
MSTITSRPSHEPLAACLPEEAPLGAGAPPALSTPVKADAARAATSRTGVEEYRENDRNQGLAGRALERAYEETLRTLPPGGRLELSTHGMLRLEVAGEVKAQVEVARLRDGAYQVTVRGGVGVGLAGSTGEKGLEGSAMVGARGAVTLRFANAAEAADRMAALVQTAALEGARLGGGLAGQAAAAVAVRAGLVDSDATARAAQVLKNVQSFEVGLYAELKGELELTAVKAGASLAAEGTFRVDVVNGKLVYECVGQVQLQGETRESFADVSASLEGRLLLRAEVTLTKEEMDRLKEGRLEPRALMKPERIRKSLTQEVKGTLVAEGQGVSYTAKRELPLESLGDVARLGDVRGSWEVSAMTKTSAGLDGEWKVDAGIAELKVGVSMEAPLFSRRMTLGEVEGAVQRARAERVSDEQLLLARRTAALR